LRILVWLYVVPLLLILAGGALMVLRYTPAVAPQHESSPRLPGFVARVQSGFGRVSGCILAIAAGTGVIIAIVWPVGYGARKFDAQDHKVYNWVLVRAHTHWLHSAMSTLTKMSNNRESQVVAGVFMILLTLSWFRHRRGLAVLAPGVLIITAYELEHQLQHTLKLLAARTGPVPAGVGSFPSGGVARLICIYGLILYLVLRRLNLTRSRWAVGGWTILAAATYTESYSRLYLGKHWISDIFGGLVFGAILLVVLIAATQLLDRPAPGPRGSVAPEVSSTSSTPDVRAVTGSVAPLPRLDEPGSVLPTGEPSTPGR
jgi:membrane-associated phospholipid phosphatase